MSRDSAGPACRKDPWEWKQEAENPSQLRGWGGALCRPRLALKAEDGATSRGMWGWSKKL